MKKIIFIACFFMSSNVFCQTAIDYNNRGLTKAELEDHRGAIADYNKSIELNPKDTSAYLNRGLVKLKLSDKNGGCLDFSKAGELGHSKAYDAIKTLCN